MVVAVEMTAKNRSAEDKRHSWAWQGCGSTIRETVGGDILEGTSQTYLSNSVEVLKPADDKNNYELMMMVPLLEKDPPYNPDKVRDMGASNRKSDGQEVYKISNPEIDLTMDAETLMAELGELKSLIANGCAPVDAEHFNTACHAVINEIPEVTADTKQIVDDSKYKMTRMEVMRAVSSTVFYILLLLAESFSWLSMYNNSTNPTRDFILFFLIFPTISSAAGWICYNFQDRSLSCPNFCKVLVLVVLSVPSPIFL